MNAISKKELLQAIKDNEKKNHPISLDFNFENDDIVDTLLTLFNNKEKYTITKILSVLTKYKVSESLKGKFATNNIRINGKMGSL